MLVRLTLLVILSLALALPCVAAETVGDLKANLHRQAIEVADPAPSSSGTESATGSGRATAANPEAVQNAFEKKYRVNLRDTADIFGLLDQLVEAGNIADLAALGNALVQKYKTNRELASLLPVYLQLAICLEEQNQVERIEQGLPAAEGLLDKINPVEKVKKFNLDALKKRVTERYQKIYYLFLGQYRKAFLAHLKDPGPATLDGLRAAERRMEKVLLLERRVKKSALDAEETVPQEHNRLTESPKNPKQVPADFIQVDSPDKVRIANVMWRFEPPAAPVYKTVTIDVSKVKNAFYVSERFAPEWVAAHGMILVTMKDATGIVTDDGEATNALFLSVEAWIRKDQSPDLVSGIKRNFKLIYLLMSMEAGCAVKCTSQAHKVDMFELNLTAGKKKELLREMLFQAICNRSQEYYHTLANSCVTNAVKCVNDVLEPQRRLNFWTIGGVLHNLKISVPVFLNQYLIEKKITTLSEVILPDNYRKFLDFNYSPITYPGKKWDSSYNIELQKKLDEASAKLR